MENRFPNGQRVELSEEGKRSFSPERTGNRGLMMGGVVIGQSYTPGCRVVVWSNRKSKGTMHTDFLEPATE